MLITAIGKLEAVASLGAAATSTNFMSQKLPPRRPFCSFPRGLVAPTPGPVLPRRYEVELLTPLSEIRT